MNRRVAAIMIVATLAAGLFASVATSGGVDMWTEPQWEVSNPPPTPDDIGTSESDNEPIEVVQSSSREPLEVPDWIRAIVRALLVAAAIIIAIYGLVVAWERRPRLRWGRRKFEDFEALPDVATAIIEEASAQRRLLQDGTPRNAIVQCWLRLEADVAAAGLQRDPADTSAEFTERVLQTYAVDTEAIRTLSALYREARFSDHPIDETARDTALDALGRLHHALAESLERSASLDAGVAQ